MKNIIYRVIIKVSYYSVHFEFESIEQACKFATTALMNMVGNEDTTKKTSITLLIVDVDAENEEKRIAAEKKAAEEKEKANAEE